MFDVIIFSFLIFSGAFLVHLGVEWKHHRKLPVLWWLGVLLFASWMLVFYGSFIEPKRLVTNKITVSFSQDSVDSIKIALLSDLHVGRYKGTSWTEKVVEQVNMLQPDVVFIAGDFIYNFESSVVDLDPLKNLVAPEGVYAVTGNHDYEGNRVGDIVEKLEEAGVTVLKNETVPLRPSTRDLPRLLLSGVSDIWFDGNIVSALEGVKEEDQVILLSHNPDVAKEPMARLADLIVAGHTHGGQIRLPFIGPVGIIPTTLGQKYDKGLFSASVPGTPFGFENKSQKLFITSGVGETGPRARLFNPPEIVLMFLER